MNVGRHGECKPARELGIPKFSPDRWQRGETVTNKELEPSLSHAVARQLLLGRRESLTIAGELGVPVAAVNEALLRLRDLCNGCMTLRQPYVGEPRFTVVVDGWEPLKRLGCTRDQPTGEPR
jgi:hypothetical protein